MWWPKNSTSFYHCPKIFIYNITNWLVCLCVLLLIPPPLFYIQHNCGLLQVATQPDISLISISPYTIPTFFCQLRWLKGKFSTSRELELKSPPPSHPIPPPSPKNLKYKKRLDSFSKQCLSGYLYSVGYFSNLFTADISKSQGVSEVGELRH